MEVKDRIIEKAKELFFSLGFRAVTLDQISRELGISKKTVYQYFKDKNKLVEEVTIWTLTNEIRHEELIQSSVHDPIDQILESTKQIRELLLKVKPGVFFEMQKYHPTAWKIYEGFKINFKALIKENLTRGVDLGLYRKEINIEILSQLRIAQVDLAFDTSYFPADKFRVIDVQLEFINHFLRGILTSKGLVAYENKL